LEPFSKVYDEIKEHGYRNEWVWKKPLKSPDRNLTAEVYCQHNVKSMDISIVIRNKNGDLRLPHLIISELPDEFAYARHLGKLIWLSNKEVALISKDETQEWKVSIE
jgi:hypothetical protein